MAITVNSYNLRNVSESDARAKGDVFFQCWKDFHAEQARQAAEKTAAAEASAAADYVLNG